MTIEIERLARQIREKFNNPEACRRFLFSYRWPAGYQCPNCGYGEYYDLPKRQLYQCKSCGYQGSETAGTALHRTRVSLQTWFAFILYHFQTNRLSTSDIANRLDVSYHTVYRMMTKTRQSQHNRQYFENLSLRLRQHLIADEGIQPDKPAFPAPSFTPHNGRLFGDPSGPDDARFAQSFDKYAVTEILEAYTDSATYRGRQLSDNVPVILRSINRQSPFSYRIPEIADVRNKWQVKVEGLLQIYEVINLDAGLLVVLEDIGGFPLSCLVPESTVTLHEFFEIGIPLIRTLNGLHHQDIFQVRLRPEGIFYNPKTGQVRLLAPWISSLTDCQPDPVDNQFRNLAYVSPEQTGRIAGQVDFRTDFYSLGAVFYRLLSGKPPFQSKSPAELIHEQIARQPIPLHHVSGAIPPTLSNIVAKLMAKNPEDRYQSCHGIIEDLTGCLHELEMTGGITEFEPGRNDLPERPIFRMSLLGRQKELARLQAIFNEIEESNPPIVLVSGYAGIGKTALVNAFAVQVQQQNGYFCTGKFDPLHRHMPYFGIILALREIVSFIFGKPAEYVSQITQALNRSLGAYGRILTNLIPELTQLIGTQPELPKMDPIETQSRFNNVVLNFLMVFCQPTHPVVLFLDDLQWVDMASLEMIAFIASRKNNAQLLLVGAYRDNEVDPTHPLMKFISGIDNDDPPVPRINLNPLTRKEVVQLVESVLTKRIWKCHQLVDLIYQKTGGNPFFVFQFITTLYSEKILQFSISEKRWKWQPDRVHQLGLTDNVVSMLAGRLKKLPQKMQRVLAYAACFGHRFTSDMLNRVCDFPQSEIRKYLLLAQKEQLIVSDSTLHLNPLDQSNNPAFQFLHDRIQQAAYALLNQQDRKKAHLRIGQVLLQETDNNQSGDRLIDSVNHLNRAVDLLKGKKKQKNLIRLNLQAGEAAKSAAAFKTAFTYFNQARQLLPDNPWQSDYGLTLTVTNLFLESASLAGHFEKVDQTFREIEKNSRSSLDKVDSCHTLITAYMARTRLQDAKKAGFKILSELENEGKPLITPARDKKTPQPFKSDTRQIHHLAELPEMTNPRTLAIMTILADLTPTCYFVDSKQHNLIVRKAMDLTRRFGNSHLSPFFYCLHGAELCGKDFEIDTGYRLGTLGLKLLDKLENSKTRARAIHIFNMHIRHFKEHLKETLIPLLEAYREAVNCGDFQHAGYSINAYCFHIFLLGRNLLTIGKEMAVYNDKARSINQMTALNLIEINQQAVFNLSEPVDNPVTLVGRHYNESIRLKEHLAQNDGNALFYFYYNKMVLCYLFHDFETAAIFADKAGANIDAVQALAVIGFYYFYDSLIQMACYPTKPGKAQKKLDRRLEQNRKIIKTLATHAPSNFLNKTHLIEAERLRMVNGNMAEIVAQYDAAIKTAQANGYVQEVALANELAARYWQQKNLSDISRTYLQKAVEAYTDWGAENKIRQLTQKNIYPGIELSRQVVPDQVRSTFSDQKQLDAISHLDKYSLVKFLQEIYGEVNLERLFQTSLKILIQNTGAQKGLLFRQATDSLHLVAVGSLDSDGITCHFETRTVVSDWPVAIVNYVARRKEPLVLENCSSDRNYTDDKYVANHQPKSVLCTPILHQEKMLGIFYFENNLVTGAFTQERLDIIRILSSQIAISMENALLYENLKQTEKQYRGIFENAIAGIYQTTLSGKFIAVNQAMADIFGFSTPDDFIREILSIDHHLYTDSNQKTAFIHLMRENKTASGMDIEFYRKDGSRFWASVHAKPIYDQNNQFLYIQGMVTDNTATLATMNSLREREKTLRKENLMLRSDLKDRFKFGDIVGRSAAMQEVYNLILKLAASEVNVIIYGESGTGKELVANAIHKQSRRRDGALVPVNCGAIPENLFESEFFGYKKGAFTGASTDKTGYLDMAHNGTLFLDELSELPLTMQVKLLRAIEGNGFTPVGGKTVTRTDARIIAATHGDLFEKVEQGTFREDFFFRIHIAPIHLPPLRERKEDIPLLIEHFIKLYRYENELASLDSRTLAKMIDYDWPGNVRELQNTIHRYAAIKKLDFITESHDDQATEAEPVPNKGPGPVLPIKNAVSQFEKEYLKKTLEENDWHREKAAEILGISRMSLFNKMKKYHLEK